MRIASAFPPVARQWLLGRRSPLTVAGAAAALRGQPRTAFPFHPLGLDKETAREPSRGREPSKAGTWLSTVCICALTDCACRWPTGHGQRSAAPTADRSMTNTASASVEHNGSPRFLGLNIESDWVVALAAVAGVAVKGDHAVAGLTAGGPRVSERQGG
jgi:hypothetical protein